MQHSKQIRMQQERLHHELTTQKTADGHASSVMRTVALVLVIVPPLNSTTPSNIETKPPPPDCAQQSRTRRRLRPKPPPPRPRASAPTPSAAGPRARMLRCPISPRRRTPRRPCPCLSRRRGTAHECNAPHARRRRPPASPIELTVRRAAYHAHHAGMRLQPTHPMQRALRAACDQAPESRRMQCSRHHPSCTKVDTTRPSICPTGWNACMPTRSH
jgi:hypothetical protein